MCVERAPLGVVSGVVDLKHAREDGLVERVGQVTVAVALGDYRHQVQTAQQYLTRDFRYSARTIAAVSAITPRK